MRNLQHILSALGLALIITSNAQAITIPLTNLFAGGSITAGDKLFDQWTLIGEYSSEENRAVNTDNIQVTALDDGGMDPGPGLQFNILNDEFSVTGDPIYGYAYLDFTFGFRVSVLDPNLRIKDNSLELNAYSLVPGSDSVNDLGIYIQETVGTVPGLDALATKEVTVDVLDGAPTSDLFDSATFALQSEIWVTKNILVWASNTDETANLQGFSQRFSQTTVPEPGTLGLLALGCVGLIGLGWQRGRYGLKNVSYRL